MVFTAFPIAYYSIFDWEKTKPELMAHPELYEIGLKNTEFSTFVFWESYVVAILQSIVLTLVTFYTLDDTAGYTFRAMRMDNDEGMRPITGSLYLNGIFIFQAIVVIVNIKILIHSSTHSWLGLFLQWASIGAFYGAYALLSSPFLNQDVLGTFFILEGLFTNWMLLSFFTLGYCCLEYIMKIMYGNLYNVYQF